MSTIKRQSLSPALASPNESPMPPSTPREIPSYSHPVTTEVILSLLKDEADLSKMRILDLGAGPGYLSWKLDTFLAQRNIDGRDVITACDLYPEQFKYDRLTCQYGDFVNRLPFDDNTFDYVLCMEVIEHVPNQKRLIEEIARILKPGGRTLITTPNTLNINARLRYLLTGTMPLYDIMPIAEADVILVSGHINPISAYYLYYFARIAGLDKVTFHTDRYKKSATFMGALFWPVIQFATMLSNFIFRTRLPYWHENRAGFAAVNSFKLLAGRTTILDATKTLSVNP